MREVAWARLQGPVTSVLHSCWTGVLCCFVRTPEHTPRLLFLLYLYQLFKLVALVCQYVCSSFTVRVYLSTNRSVFESRQSHGALALTLCGGSAHDLCLGARCLCGPHSRVAWPRVAVGVAL